jgi:hypothetical protein
VILRSWLLVAQAEAYATGSDTWVASLRFGIFCACYAAGGFMGEANDGTAWGIRLGLASGGCAYRNFRDYIWRVLGSEEAEE